MGHRSETERLLEDYCAARRQVGARWNSPYDASSRARRIDIRSTTALEEEVIHNLQSQIAIMETEIKLLKDQEVD